MTGFICQHRINADHISAILVLAGKMTVNIIVRQLHQFSVRTLCAFEFPFVTESRFPFVAADRLITAFLAGLAVPAFCEYVGSANEQRTEQGDFFVGCAVFVDASTLLNVNGFY